MKGDEAVLALAAEAGLEIRWTDAGGCEQRVGLDTLKAVLRALDLSADTRADIAESRERLRGESKRVPQAIVAQAGAEVRLAGCRSAVLFFAHGAPKRWWLRTLDDGVLSFRAPRQPGYYWLECDGELRELVVAPKRCLKPDDLVMARRLAGISLQVYALRGGTSGTFGDYRALGSFAKRSGRLGYDAILASPTHAQFGANPGQFTPYAPSTRYFLNPLFADATLEGGPAQTDDRDANGLINWREDATQKYASLRVAFDRFRRRNNVAEFEHFCREGGQRLLAHALFEALDKELCAVGIRDRGKWPAGFESPSMPGVRDFAHARREAVEFELFLQWLAARSAATAQKTARQTMAIGIVADIAVGMDPLGSHAWSAPQELLRGLHVGAPPDVFNSRGQDWGLTTLSPRALKMSAYAPFIATLRASMRQAGGVRIDHAMGLRRLWVIPAGASPQEGAYLRYPERELLRLLALESQLNRAIVIGEDLGTVPEGFSNELARTGVLGTQVLWFERDQAGRFNPPRKWWRNAVATTATHDLATVAGWWSGHDIDWQARLHHLPGSETRVREERAADRAQLWSAFRRSRCATGSAPKCAKPDAVVDAALAYVARTNCMLAFAPLEDIAGDREQPNLPGTIDEHPNWRRRVKRDLLADKNARARLRNFAAARLSP